MFLVSFKVTVSNSLLHIFASEKGVSDRTFQRARFHPRLFLGTLSLGLGLEMASMPRLNLPQPHGSIPPPPRRIAGHTPNF